MRRIVSALASLLIVGGPSIFGPAATGRNSLVSNKQAAGCSAWVEISSSEAGFRILFPDNPNYSLTKFADGKRWALYVGGRDERIFAIRYRKVGSLDPKWTSVEITDHKGIGVLKQSSCLLSDRYVHEEIRKSFGSNTYEREIVVETSKYFYILSIAEAKTVRELESEEVECFFNSFRLAA